MKRYNFKGAERRGFLETARKNAIVDRIRDRYSIEDELALLRQRDTKPEEFAEYNAFVEQIKADVNAECEKVKENT